ncbi:MAG: DNA-3-methyladenine glycosylase family protein [Spirochaetia bacterium]
MRRVLTHASLGEGAEALRSRDRDLGRILDTLGVPPLWARRPGFPALVRIILEQQVSLAAARTLYRRLVRRLGGMRARGVSAMGEEGLREFGLTRQKARYCHGLAARILEGTLDLSAVAALPDAAGRSILLSIPGLGPWSVDIYYLMALRRPDVWPEGDLALASALREVKKMPALPTRENQRAIAARWSPWRSIAARLLWAHYLAARGEYEPPA